MAFSRAGDDQARAYLGILDRAVHTLAADGTDGKYERNQDLLRQGEWTQIPRAPPYCGLQPNRALVSLAPCYSENTCQ